MRKAISVGVNVHKPVEDFEYSMQELGNLAAACDITVEASLTQNMQQFHKGHYIGTGKLQELQMMVQALDVDAVLFDDELTPTQMRNLEAQLGVAILDRTMLILDIFAERAKTRESQLQVEMARLKYMLPRLVGMREYLSRQGGGSGLKNRGAGETKLELDRRRIEEKINALDKELEKLLVHRSTQRNLRKRRGIPIVSLVGYTNAGKSTMMNAMVETFHKGEDKLVLEKDMLFATLETSVREIRLMDNRQFLLTDTVGFINKLPHHLIKAFRSTLEEVVEADLLIHVIDYSNPHHHEQKRLTDDILSQLGAGNIPMIYAYNKADQTSHPYPQQVGDNVYVSARERVGIDQLTEMIMARIFADYVQCELLIPYNEGEIVSYFNDHARVLHTDYVEEGTKLMVECKRMDADKYHDYVHSYYE